MTMVALIGLVAGLYGLHRLCWWAEDRGFIYYLRGRGSSGSTGSGLLEVQAIIEPAKRYVVVERQKECLEEQGAGDPPSEAQTRRSSF